MSEPRTILKGPWPTNQRGDEATKNEASPWIAIDADGNLHLTFNLKKHAALILITLATLFNLSLSGTRFTDDATKSSVNVQIMQSTVTVVSRN